MKKYEKEINGIRWIHFEKPSASDIEETKNIINAHPLILKELEKESDRSKIENYGSYIFAVYHIHIYEEKEKKPRRTEIDILSSPQTILTYSYEEIDPVKRFYEEWDEKIKEDLDGAYQILYYILLYINIFSLRQLRHVEEKVNAVGKKLFEQSNKILLEELSYIKRDLLEFGIVIASQRNTLDSLNVIGEKFYGEKFKFYFSDLLGSFYKVEHLLETLRVTVISYSETISQIFQFQTSELLKKFSILGFLTFPILLYATIALQPTIIPVLFKTPWDFWRDFIIVLISVVVIAIFFRKKGWF